MSRKIALTAEQAKAMDELLDVWKGMDESKRNRTLIREKFENLWVSPEFEEAKTISDEDFIAALHYGYEAEQTPEEKFAKYHEGYDMLIEKYGFDYDRGVKSGLETALEILEIEIEGVNA